MSAVYRVRQFVRAAAAWVRPGNTGEARASPYLPPAAMGLFQAMPRYDQQHALDVLHTLQEWQYDDADLLAAALLHDVGKTAQQAGALHLWHRVAVVLIGALGPGLLERIGKDRKGSWREPFFVQQHHAALGAELARQADCSPRTVGLVLHHEDPSAGADDPLLAALQAADAVN